MGDVIHLAPSLYCSGCRETHRDWFEDANQPGVYVCRHCFCERPRIVEVEPSIEETEDGCEVAWRCPRCGDSTGITVTGDDSDALARHFQRQIEHGDYDPRCALCSSENK